MHEVADVVHVLEFCEDGASCTVADETGLINLLNSTKVNQLNVIVLTVGTGSVIVTEGKDAASLQLPGQQENMFSLISIYAPSIPVVVFVYSAGPVNIAVATSSPQVTFLNIRNFIVVVITLFIRGFKCSADKS